MTEKELLQQIKQFKTIKPRNEWVVLAKSQVFAESATAEKMSFFDFIASGSYKRNLAYSLATLALIMAGLVGFAQNTMPGDLLFPVRRIAEQSQAALTGQTGLRQDVATLNNRINDLAQAAKQGRTGNIPSAINEINTKASELAKTIKEHPVEDTATLKEIAVSLKTLADVQGTDLSETPEVKDLYQAVVENQIADLEKTTLTEEQGQKLIEIKALYEEGKYIDALEQILTI